MASRKAVVASLPALFLISALLFAMAGPGAISEEGATTSQQFHPASLDRSPELPSSPKNSRGIRAGGLVVSTSLDDDALPSAPATMVSAMALPERTLMSPRGG
jgi:hypothetical protein